MPILHGDDVKVGADVILGVEKLGELSNREAITQRQGKITNEIRSISIEHGAFHDFTAQRVRPVEDKEGNVAFGGLLHAISHPCGVRVKPHAGGLNVKPEG